MVDAAFRGPLAVLAVAGSLLACESAPLPKAPAATVTVDRDAASRAVGLELDDLHEAAAKADESRYFGHFANDAVFLGTDGTERWDMPAFRAFAHPHFAAGKAWTFHASRRAITISDDGHFAYFDEDLVTEKLGPARGSGVLSLHPGSGSGLWKIEQYNLTLTIPNERFAEVRALIDKPAPLPFAERGRAAYARATARAAQGDLAGAERELGALAEEADGAEDDAAFWLHNQKTWLRWAAGDLAGALDEVDRAKGALARSKLPAEARARTGLHEKWDRDYLLLELAAKAPPGLRVEANRAADAARADYEAAATPQGDHDGLAVLSAFFAVRRNNGKQALEAASRVNPETDTDLQDLYVLSLAYDSAKQPARAEEIRRRIRDAKEYLMKPLIVRQMDAERAAKK